MKDITYCINKECKERKDCFRAEDNFKNDELVRSYAMFNCNDKSFEPIKCWVCGSNMNYIYDIDMERLQSHRFECAKCEESVLVPFNAPFLKL